MSDIGIGIIGQGVGHSRAQIAKATEGMRLVAIADLHEDRRQRAEQEFGVPAYADYRRLLDDRNIHVIGIFTPAGYRRELALEAFAAGKHVILTKPMEVNIERCDDIISAAKNGKRHLLVDFDSRYRPANRAIKKAIDDRLFGRILMAEVKLKCHRDQPYYDWDGGWRGTWRLDGGGSLANQTIHYIDRIQWFMGEPDSVFGYVGVFNHDIGAEDQGAAVIRWKNGALGTIVGATTTVPDFAFTRVEIHGDRGGVVTMSASGSYIPDPKRGQQFEGWIQTDETLKTIRREPIEVEPGPNNIMEDFVSVMTKGTKPMVDGREGRKSVEILNGIYASSQSGKEVKFPLAKPFIPKGGYREQAGV